MRLSTRGRYAVMAMVEMAAREGRAEACTNWHALRNMVGKPLLGLFGREGWCGIGGAVVCGAVIVDGHL